MNDRQDLARVIKNTATYYGRELKPEVLSMMCDDLADLPIDDVIAAYNAYRRNPKNRAFPLPAQIIEIVCPEQHVSHEDQAAEIAARIVGAVTRYGWNNSKYAQEFIGPVGWGVVERQGGWAHLCQNLGVTIDPSTFQAQVRRQLEANLRYGEETLSKVISLPTRDRRSGDLVSASEIVKQLTSKNEPKEPA
jgi:hypothetical protein